MKYLLALPAAFALVAAAAPQPEVYVADGNWNQLPSLRQLGSDHLSGNAMQKLFQIARNRECKLPGYDSAGLNLNVSFAAQYNPDGSLKQLVLPKLNCAEGEGVIAGAVLQMLQNGDYKRVGQSPDGWYQGNFGFAYSG